MAQSKVWNLKTFSLLLIPALCLLFVGFVFGGSAKAETNVPISYSAPTPNSGTSGGADFTPYSGVGQGKFDGQYSWYKIYIRGNTDSNITIDQKCDAVVGNPTVDYTIQSLSKQEFNYRGNWGTEPTWVSATKASANCNQNISFTIPGNVGTNSSIKGHENFRVFAFLAAIEQVPPGPSNEGYFTVNASSNTSNIFIGMSKSDWTDREQLSFSTVYKPGGTWSFSVISAPQCDTGPGNATIQVHDADNGTYQVAPDYMTASIESSPAPGTVPWTPTPPGSWNGAQVQGGAIGANNTTSSLTFPYDGTHTYKFHVLNSKFPNTIQINLPFDQFDASLDAQNVCQGPPPPVCPAGTFGTPPQCCPNGSNGPWPSCTTPGPVRCNIVNQPVVTTPGAAVNFPVRITAGNTAISSPGTKLYIVGPSGVTGSFNIPPLGPGESAQITVSIVNVPSPPSTQTYPAYRTYQLGTSQGNTFGGTCAPNLEVRTTPVLHGELSEFGCRVIAGHVWNNDTDATPTVGRLHIISNSDPTEPIDTYTRGFGTAGAPYAGGAGGKWWAIDPYNYNSQVPVGPAIDIQLDYHHVYTLILQWRDESDPSGNTFHDAYDAAGNLATRQMEFPCITGNIDASCTNFTGNLAFKSTQPANTTGFIESDGVNGAFFPAHYHFGDAGDLSGERDPFYAPTTGVQLLPHQEHNFKLLFLDYDSLLHQVYNNDINIPATSHIDPCLDWGACTPSQVTFEVTGSVSQDFTMGYINRTKDNIPGYYGAMTSTNQVLINNGQGTLTSSGGINSNGSPPTPGSLIWSGISVSGTGPPYQGTINLVGTYQGTPIGGASCLPINVYQVTKPYLKAFGASVSTGGAFADASAPDSSVCSGPQRQGGAKTFARFNPSTTNAPGGYTDSKMGASVEYSIESLGSIDGNNPGGYGFYSGDTHDPPNGVNTLDLSNQTNANSWGGNLGGAHCVPDYYARHTGKETAWNNDTVAQMFNLAHLTPQNAEAFIANPGPGKAIDLATQASSIEAGNSSFGVLRGGTRVTLFVNGDVFIDADIIYGDEIKYDPSKVSGPNGEGDTRPPYFTLIATGSIYVSTAVQELDGLYVAQGQTGAGDGFSTCGQWASIAGTASNMPTNLIGPNPGQSCNYKLVVRGSVVANQLKLLRVGNQNNTLRNATGDNGSSIIPGKHNNAVEEFNYTPQMVQNSPYFLSSDSGGLGNPEKIFSLPPVY